MTGPYGSRPVSRLRRVPRNDGTYADPTYERIEVITADDGVTLRAWRVWTRCPGFREWRPDTWETPNAQDERRSSSQATRGPGGDAA